MQCLAIICESHINSDEIATLLRERQGFHIKIYKSALPLVGAVNDGLVDGLVFGISQFTTKKAQMLDVIKSKLPTFPIVLASEKLDSTSRLLATAYEKFTIVKYPEEIETIDGIFAKMFRDLPVGAREHVRYDTKLEASLFVHGVEVACTIQNLSQGGAQIELHDVQVVPNQELKLHVPLFNELKNHKVSGKAVWVQKLNSYSIIGLEFSNLDYKFYG